VSLADADGHSGNTNCSAGSTSSCPDTKSNPASEKAQNTLTNTTINSITAKTNKDGTVTLSTTTTTTTATFTSNGDLATASQTTTTTKTTYTVDSNGTINGIAGEKKSSSTINLALGQVRDIFGGGQVDNMVKNIRTPAPMSTWDRVKDHKYGLGGTLLLGGAAICALAEPCGAFVGTGALIGGTVAGTGGVAYDMATH
jgi:hypothetical protein